MTGLSRFKWYDGIQSHIVICHLSPDSEVERLDTLFSHDSLIDPARQEVCSNSFNWPNSKFAQHPFPYLSIVA